MKITVNGMTIPPAVFERELEQARQGMPNAKEEERVERVKNNLIRQALLRETAGRQVPSFSTDEVDMQFRRFTEQFGGTENFLKQNNISQEQLPFVKADIEANMKVEKFLETLTQHVVLPSETLLRQYHAKDKSVSTVPTTRHALQIVKRFGAGVAETLSAVRQRLIKGEKFMEMVNQYSDAQDHEAVDFGFVAPGQLIPELNDVIFSLNVGEVSPVVHSPYGLHLITVVEEQGARVLTYEESADRVKAKVLSEMKDAVVRDWMEKALKSAKVELSE